MKRFFSTSFLCVFWLWAFPILLNGQTAGAPDLGFGTAGEARVEDLIKNYYGGPTVLLPDGKIIIAGYEFDPSGENGVLVFSRFLPNGLPDPSYGVNGRAYPSIDLGFDGGIYDIALTADNKIIAAGYSINDTASVAVAIRFDVNGNLDPSFGQNGFAIINAGTESDEFWTVLINPDGGILLGGATYTPTSTGVFDLLLVKLLSDGALDTTFSGDGIATADFTVGLESILNLALQADGKIVAICGKAEVNYDMEVVRFLPNGSVDAAFANNGVFAFGVPGREDVSYAGAIQADQKIVFCGTSFQNGSSIGEVTLFRLNPDGSFDPTFGTGGKVFTNVGFSEFARAMIIQPDGKLLVSVESVESLNDFHGRFWVLRYNTDGTLDNTFSGDGKTQSPTYTDITETSDILLQPDGKIIQSGTVQDKLILRRYLNDQMVSTSIPEIDFQFQISPNPSKDYTMLSWTLPTSDKVSADLFDPEGRLVQTLFHDIEMISGNHQKRIVWSPAIPAGVYYLRFSVDKESQMIKLIKQ